MTIATMVRGARGRVFSPSAVLIGSNVLVNVMRIGSTMLLTRLMAPRDFGLTGIIFSVFFIVSMITDAGFQAFIIRHERGEEPEFLDVIWTIHALRGTALWLLLMLCSYPIGLIVGKPEVTPLLAVASLVMAIEGLLSPAAFVVLRTGGARLLSVIDLAVAVVQMAASVIAAYILRDAWAMVASMILGSATKVACSYLVLPNPMRRIRFDSALSSELWRFSRIIAASSMLTMVISQVDKLVLARVFTLPEFGVYTIGSNLANAPVAIVLLYTSRIFYPAVAQAWRADPAHIRRTAYASRGFVFHGYLFAAGGLAGGAPILIRLLYDPRYAGASAYLGILAIATAMVMITRTMGESLVAIGRTRATLMMNVARIVWLILMGLLGFVLAGPVGLVLALGLIEIPAYGYGLVALRRYHLLDAPRELGALLLVIGGIGAGRLGTVLFDMLWARP